MWMGQLGVPTNTVYSSCPRPVLLGADSRDSHKEANQKNIPHTKTATKPEYVRSVELGKQTDTQDHRDIGDVLCPSKRVSSKGDL